MDDAVEAVVHELVESDRAFTETSPEGSWEDVYAERIVERFG